MDISPFENIKIEVEKLAEKIQAPKYLLPIYGVSLDDRPCVDINSDGQFSLIYSERGKVNISDLALDINHLLYLVFRNVTYSMALEYVLLNHDQNIDDRRLLFQKQLELLGKIDTEWQKREHANQEQILRQYPLNDYAGKKQAYLRELLGNGFLYNEALEKANQQYP